MAIQKPVSSQGTNNISALAQIINQLRLVWLLFQDKRISIWVKSVVPLFLLYVISPVDILPDVFLGIGQLDDLGVILLGVTLLLKLCPPEVVDYYRGQLSHGSDDDVIDATYHEVKDNK